MLCISVVCRYGTAVVSGRFLLLFYRDNKDERPQVCRHYRAGKAVVYFGVQYFFQRRFCEIKMMQSRKAFGLEEFRLHRKGGEMMEKKWLCGYYNYTVVLTYLGMLSGFTGIIFAMEGSFRQAVICLMTAGVCDMFDGTIAATKERDTREKSFGIQIDSLSDLICFGVLPALFTYQIGQKSYLAFLACCTYVLCALIRLAYFNVLEEERQQKESGLRKWYLGLPVTSAALVLPAFYVIQSETGMDARIFPGLLVVMAAAFILPVKIKKPYLAGKIGLAFTGVVEFIILLAGFGMEV